VLVANRTLLKDLPSVKSSQVITPQSRKKKGVCAIFTEKALVARRGFLGKIEVPFIVKLKHDFFGNSVSCDSTWRWQSFSEYENAHSHCHDASSFDLWTSLFADDCAIFFNSPADLDLGKSYLFNHLRCYGLMMHIGVDTTLSKTEAIYFPPPRVDYSTADTSCLDIRNSGGSTVGFVDFTKEFKYLGSNIDSSLTSDADVQMRIKEATSAFGAL
jgi:hypothetical protein